MLHNFERKREELYRAFWNFIGSYYGYGYRMGYRGWWSLNAGGFPTRKSIPTGWRWVKTAEYDALPDGSTALDHVLGRSALDAAKGLPFMARGYIPNTNLTPANPPKGSGVQRLH